MITGVAGFIGSALAQRLVSRGMSVVGVDNLSPYYDVSLKRARLATLTESERFRFAEVDISDSQALDRIFDETQPESVVNLAAQVGVRHSLVDPAAYITANLVGFGNVLENCRRSRVAHLVFASSSSVYGSHLQMPFAESEHVAHPVSLYAGTKAANELLAHSYASVHGLPSTGLRLFTVYGPWGRPDMALFEFTRRILAGEAVPLHNSGDMKRDFTYIDDVVEVITRALDRPPGGDKTWDAFHPDPATSDSPYLILNVASGRPVELRRYLDLLAAALGVTARVQPVPMTPGELVNTHASTERLHAWLGYKPSTPVEEGIPAFAEWYVSYYGRSPRK